MAGWTGRAGVAAGAVCFQGTTTRGTVCELQLLSKGGLCERSRYTESWCLTPTSQVKQAPENTERARCLLFASGRNCCIDGSCSLVGTKGHQRPKGTNTNGLHVRRGIDSDGHHGQALPVPGDGYGAVGIRHGAVLLTQLLVAANTLCSSLVVQIIPEQF